MENFDAVGKWRTEDAGSAIDPTGVTNDGVSLDGVRSLRELTLRKGDLFAQVVAEKLLTYALGRGLDYQDMPLVRSITRTAADARLSVLGAAHGGRPEPGVHDERESRRAGMTTAANEE